MKKIFFIFILVLITILILRASLVALNTNNPHPNPNEYSLPSFTEVLQHFADADFNFNTVVSSYQEADKFIRSTVQQIADITNIFGNLKSYSEDNSFFDNVWTTIQNIGIVLYDLVLLIGKSVFGILSFIAMGILILVSLFYDIFRIGWEVVRLFWWFISDISLPSLPQISIPSGGVIQSFTR